jgi:DNA primase
VIKLAEWVDFNEILEKVSIKEVLKHYGLKLTQKGSELRGICPFCQSSYSSFSANVEKNVFQCFVCQRKGNVLRFVAEKEGKTIREAGLFLKHLFLKPVENRPLPLKNLQKDHPFFKEKGLKEETIEYFGLGVCQGWVVIPVHSENEQLIGYVSRYPSRNIPEGVPKYKFPTGFQKSKVLYNLNRAKKETKETLYLVEGFFDVFDLWQKGKKNVVALMGTTISDKQIELILRTIGRQGKLNLAFDPDEAGKKLEQRVIEKLIDKLYIRVRRLK